MRSIFLLCLLTGPLLQAESLFQPKVHAAYASIWSFEEVDTTQFDLEERQFLAMQWHWWQYLRGLEGNGQILERYCKRIISRYPPKTKMSNVQLFLGTVAYGYLTRLQLIKEERIAASSTYLESLEYLNIWRKRSNLPDEIALIDGLYNAVVGSLREQFLYRSILLFFPESDKESGLATLAKYASSTPSVAKTEALYFQFKISHQVEGESALKPLQALCRLYPNNWLLRLEYCQQLEGRQRVAELKKLEEHVRQSGVKPQEFVAFKKQVERVQQSG